MRILLGVGRVRGSCLMNRRLHTFMVPEVLLLGKQCGGKCCNNAHRRRLEFS